MSRISVIGDGGWGTALAILLHSKGVETVLWSVSPEYAGYMDRERENIKFLKGVTLPGDLRITADDAVARDAACAIFAVPCEYLRSVAERFAGAEFDHVVSATKGIENGSLERPSEILAGYFGQDKVSVVSGPSISFEVARGLPTTVVVASNDGSREHIRDILMCERFRVYTSGDVTGVEMGGALKNVIAIASGISDGLGFGTNAKAALLTRGLAEITRLGVSMGADRATFRGLSGIGDLATTCISSHSRNRWFGEQIGAGRAIDDIMAETEMVVEGMGTCRAAHELAGKQGVDMPITTKVYEVLYGGKDPGTAVRELMTRDPKEED